MFQPDEKLGHATRRAISALPRRRSRRCVVAAALRRSCGLDGRSSTSAQIWTPGWPHGVLRARRTLTAYRAA